MGHVFRLIAQGAHYDIAKFGRGGIGIVLACRYHTDEPWMTIKELDDYLSLSSAQIRRRLTALEEEGKVTSHRDEQTGACRYSIAPQWAYDYGAKLLEEIAVLQNENAVASL